jgi:hypothetical protein
MATLDPEKEWAKDYKSQIEFEAEFQRRNPLADSIPKVDEWLGRPAPKYAGIDGINLEDLKIDDTIPHPEKKGEAKKKVFACKGCKREFEYGIAKYQHEKKCEVLLAEKSL